MEADMSIFDSLKNAAADAAGQEAHEAFGAALQNTQLGDMSGLLDKLHEGGLSETVEAWADGEEHAPISIDQLKSALGDEHVQALASSLGLPVDQALQGLAEHLPALATAHIAAEDHDDADEHDDAGHDEDEAHEDETSAA
jgi:uncharacterized protein YidB (DUF937 family)